MTRRLMLAAVAALAVVLATAAQLGARGPSAREHHLTLYGYGYDFLARLDPATLRIRAKLKDFETVTSQDALSPNGSRLVVGAGFMGDGTYAVADARRMRWLDRRVKVAVGPGGYAGVGSFEWLRPHRVFALAEGTGPFAGGPVPWTRATILDVGRRRVVAKTPLPGYVVASARVRHREVLLVVGSHRLGVWRLAVVGALGYTRTVALHLPPARYSDSGFTAVGFVVDPASERAFLLPGGGPIAIVDLRRLSVRYRQWPRRAADRAKPYVRSRKNHEGDPIGPMRWAAWLGNGVIAVTGEDDRLRPGGSGETLSRPYGVELVDTRNWTARVVAQWANRLGTSGGTVFPSIGDAFVEQNPPRGSGLQAFSRHGDLLYHLYGDEAIALTVIGQRLYVRRPGRVEVLALRSGDRLRTIPFRGERGHQLFPAFGRAG